MQTINYPIKTEMPPLPEGYPISAKIVLDSINTSGNRLTTLELVFPRYVLAEFNTHRVFSKNASSSRAIPTKKAITAALDNMVMPVRFGKNKAGMQAASENLTGAELEEAQKLWRELAVETARVCTRLSELGLHKQWASRPMEWFSSIKVVMSATEFDNFFWLRDHFEAQDEICYLAQAIKVAMNNSTPSLLQLGQWHVPYVSGEEIASLGLENALKVSAARCARTSHKTHLGVTSTLEDDLKLFNEKLIQGGEMSEENPFHASPTEHQAVPVNSGSLNLPKYTGNFRGWVQYRKVIEEPTALRDLLRS